jgi:phage shock protein PspC (stress-responsive transcriptional regulator)
MHNIISVQLAGRVLPIEEQAWNRLQAYFDALRRSVEVGRQDRTVLDKAEVQLADLLSGALTPAHPTLQLADVESALSNLSFREASGSASGDTANRNPHLVSAGPEFTPRQPYTRFYRNSADKVCGGVCSGVAHYLGIDPLLIRILTVLLFCTGWGILGYLLIWVLAPEAPLEKRHSLRLYRSRTDTWLGGVCGGLASAFGKDPWIIRLVFAVPVLFGIGNGTFNQVFGSLIITSTLSGTLLLIYLLLWALLPLARPGQEQQHRK